MAETIVKIAISIPLGWGVKTETFVSFINLILNNKIDVYYNFYRNPYIHKCRNELVDQALKEKCSHILFMSDDVIFPSNGIEILLNYDKPIIGFNYNMKAVPVKTTVRMKKDGVLIIPDRLPTMPFMCDVIGMGFTLIKTEIFDKLESPYFFYNSDDSNGEDVYFCDKVQKAGYEIWCDPTISIGHVGDFVY